MHSLTDRQLEVLRFIARQIEECGYPPTIRELGRGGASRDASEMTLPSRRRPPPTASRARGVGMRARDFTGSRDRYPLRSSAFR